ncbi:MAG TPA: GDP-mannose 4,6-dehydratase [Polyangia bacterium]|nr:GDP-mannose 4,6-dehydratase [Polyangia bacterium]
MKVLVTGVAGFIGSHLAARLGARGDKLVGLDNFDETLYPAALHRRNLALVADRVEFHEGDFLDAPLVERLFAQQRFDAVVHLGALAGVRPSLAQPRRYQRVNIEGTLDLLEACRVHGVRRFVFASSSSVYGAHNEVPFRERDPAVRPASPYAASKRAGELFCSTYSDLYGIATTALRFFTVYGPRQRPEMAIHKFARLIADGKPLPFYGDGSSARDYTFIDDIIDGVVAAIDRCGIGGGGAHRVYNLGGSRTTTLARLVELIEAGVGKKAILDRQPDQPGDVPITYADVTHAAAELGYAPKIPIEDGIARFCAWLGEQQP